MRQLLGYLLFALWIPACDNSPRPNLPDGVLSPSQALGTMVAMSNEKFWLGGLAENQAYSKAVANYAAQITSDWVQSLDDMEKLNESYVNSPTSNLIIASAKHETEILPYYSTTDFDKEFINYELTWTETYINLFQNVILPQNKDGIKNLATACTSRLMDEEKQLITLWQMTRAN